MNKAVRIVLYVLSGVTVAAVLALCILSQSGGAKDAGSDGAGREENGQTPDEWQQEQMEETDRPAEEENGQTPDERQDVAELPTETDDIRQEETEHAGTDEGSGAADAEETTILFTGDVLFANSFKAGYDAKGILGVVSEEILSKLQSADILMINNEFPFSGRGEPAEDKQFTFRCEPQYVKALNEMGVDVASLANNHTLDFGKEALSDTFVTLDDAGILYGGAGETVERAQQIQIIEHNGKKFGFLAVSRVIPEVGWKVEFSTPGIFSCYDETRLIELVAEAKESCDFVAVYPHWGVEYEAYPQEYQRKIAQKCMEAGADVVVGAHTHCLQGIEFFDGNPVFYSLGNFIFGKDVEQSAIVELTVDAKGAVSYRLIPVYASNGVTYMAAEQAGEKILSYMDGISSGASVAADGTVTAVE